MRLETCLGYDWRRGLCAKSCQMTVNMNMVTKNKYYLPLETVVPVQLKEFSMKRWISRALALLFLLFLVAFAGGSSSSAAIVRPQPPQLQDDSNAVDQEPLNGSCGVERWSVKTGTDADVGLINLQSATQITIASLISLPAPTILPANNRIQPTETTIFQLHATLTEYKLEPDSDYHLVLSDGTGDTMIAEMPSPSLRRTLQPIASQHPECPLRIRRPLHHHEQLPDGQCTRDHHRCRIFRLPAWSDRRCAQRHRTTRRTRHSIRLRGYANTYTDIHTGTHTHCITKKVTAGNGHALLQALLSQDARSIYNFHKALLWYGQRICMYEHPRCEKCMITDLCNYYKAVANPH